MAYALRYYKEIAQADGGVVRLEIHKKDSTTAAVEIGAVVQGLSLEIQGQQDDIDSPIQKTSLHMTFVDASDIENGQKNGFWQEFYTPDALMWKVILKAKDATETSFRTIWGGYVTPDSFSEDLVYRGSVSITARDNIGHMQDFPFDAEGDADGMISLYNLVESGWEKIQSPMMLEWRGAAESTMWLMCDGVSAMFTLMNVSMFEGMDWYKAIETALASYGVVMRYVGNNIVKMSSLRSMPYQGEEFIEDLIHIEPTFVSGAQRELVPAVKRIEESVDYDLVTAVSMPQVKVEDFTGSTGTYRCKIDGVEIDGQSFGTAEHDAPVWSINNARGWSNIPSSTLFFNPHAYELGYFAQQRGLGEEMLRYMYIAANNVDNRVVSFNRNITCADMTIRIKFGLPCNLDIQNRFEQQSVFNLKKITFCVSLTQNGITQYYGKGGGWSTSYQQITTEYDATMPSFDFEQFIGMGEFSGLAELDFSIIKIEYAQTSFVGNISKYGLYACIQDLSFCISESTSMLETNTVNTNYQEGNNVILTRDPELAPALNTTALPAFIKNGIFYRSGDAILPAKKWSWGSGSEQQMAVWNHLQLLSYYAKPNNLISGTIVNADVTRAQAIYVWHGAEHILVSGTYNFLNGHIEGAVLREFARYEDMWSEVAGADLPDTEQDSRSNVEGGSASGGSSSTYSNTTTVNIGSGGGGGTGASNLNDLLDVDTTGVVAQSVLYYNGTSWVDMSLNTLLNPYLKADVAAKTYASKSVYEAFVASLGSLAYKNGLTASDVGALSTSGGTINGIFKIHNTAGAYNSVIEFSNTSGYLGALGVSSYNRPVFYNGAAYEDILTTSGGTISGTTNGPLVVNTTNASEVGIPLAINSSKKVWFGYSTAVGGAYMYNAVAKRYMGILDDGSAFLGGNTILHSGNVGDYKAGGLRLAKTTDLNKIPTDMSSYAIDYVMGTSLNAPANHPFGFLHQYKWGNGNWHSQLYFTISDYGNKLYSRGYRDDTQEWTAWREFAFTDSNVASAQALKHSNGTVGATAYADGKVYFENGVLLKNNSSGISVLDASNGYRSILTLGSDNNLYFGLNTQSDQMRIYGSPIRFFIGSTDAMRINSSGNVTIGASDLAGGDSRLYVDGTLSIPQEKGIYMVNASGTLLQSMYLASNGNLNVGRGVAANGGSLVLDGTSIYMRYGTGGATGLFLNTTGNVLIGTMTDAGYKLDVYGGIRAYSEIAFSRKNACYIWGEEGAVIYIGVKDVGGTSPAYASLSIGANTIRAGNRNNAVSLGDSGIRWSNVYSVDGNFSGAVTMASTLIVGGKATLKGIHMPDADTFNKWCADYNTYEVNVMQNVADGAPTGYEYGYLMNFRWETSLWSGQLYMTVSDFGSEIFTRGYRSDKNTWTTWRKFWHSENSNRNDANWACKDLSVSGPASLAGTLNVGGNTTINGNLVVAGDISA